MTPARLAAVLAATALSVTAATGCAPIPQGHRAAAVAACPFGQL